MRLRFLLASTFVACFLSVPSDAYDVGTHSRISEAAAAASQLDEVLAKLQMTSESKFDISSITREDNRGTALGWIREGSIREDGDSNCATRVRNHFYNPINNSGYFRGFLQGLPSTEWGLEDVGDANGQDYSYHDARSYFWDALTAKTDADRQRNLALTFRSVGQFIHLIQDAAQPQHTRNDSHAGFDCKATLNALGPKSLYESYVDGLARTNQLAYGGYTNVSLVQPRDYWDDGFGRGIAEFSNRNFVTAGTNFLGPPDDLRPPPDFPSPNGVAAQTAKVDIQSLIPGTPLRGKLTFISTPYDDVYIPQADRNPRTSTYSIFNPELTRRGLLPGYTLNRFNFDEAWRLLIPRAVGYSAGLMDYFFRGTLEIAPPERFSYLVAPYDDGNGQFTKLKVKVRNTTSHADTGTGTLQAIVRYRKAYLTDPLLFPSFAGLYNEPSYAVSKPLDDASLSRDFEELTFDFTDNPIPVQVGDLSIVVAFRGPLVSPEYTENDAIVFGGKDVFEPQLLDFGNSTDYDCYLSTLYDVVGATAEERDRNRDGRQDLFGPSTESVIYIKLQSAAKAVNWYDLATASYQSPRFAFAEFSRFVSVQGDDWYNVLMQAQSVVDEYTGAYSQHLSWFTLSRNINHLIEQNGKLVHEVGGYSGFTYRGTTTPAHMDVVNQNVILNSTCRDSIRSVPRAMTEVPGSLATTD